MTTSAPIRAGELELWVERRGSGPDVLLIAGLGDPAEAWQPQLAPLLWSQSRSGGRSVRFDSR